MDQERPIGQEGKNLNLSSATRAMNAEPDAEQIKQYDEYPAKLNPMFYVALFLVFGCLGGTFFLYKTGHWVWGSLLLLVSLVLLFFLRSFANTLLTKRIAYESGLIVPAILIDRKPITLLTLADMRSDTDQQPVYGCQKLILQQLPFHALEVDEKVPCTTLFGMVIKGYRRHFEPRPIAWGFTSQTHIEEARNSIEETEWELLYQLKPQMENVPEKEVVFFNEELKKIDDL